VRIIAVHNYYQQPGGEDSVFESETELLERFGHSVMRLIFRNDDIPRDPTWIQSGTLALATVWSRAAASRVAEAIRVHAPDVVHFHNTFPLISPAAYAACRRAGVPVVQTLHNYRLLCPNAQFFRGGRLCEDCLGRRLTWPGIVHRCYRDSWALTATISAMQLAVHLRGGWARDVTVFIALSEFGRSKFVEGGVPSKSIVVKPNFVDPDPGFREGGGGNALFVGRLSAEKGIDTLLRTWDQLPASTELRIAGDGPMQSHVAAAAETRPNIKWLGRVPRESVLEEMGRAEVLVFPSVWYEGLPRTIIESFAVGTPVIASNLGGLADLVRDGRNGRTFPAGDATALARRVTDFLSPTTDRQAFRREARESYTRSFTASENARQLENIYRIARDRFHSETTRIS
jgi:glycosyltransferase involved in cell wall biosynthesis